MSYDEAVAARVRRILSRRRDVVEKQMVGGLSFIVRGSMCCGVTGDRVMVRVGPEARQRILEKPHTEPMRLPGDRWRVSCVSNRPATGPIGR